MKQRKNKHRIRRCKVTFTAEFDFACQKLAPKMLNVVSKTNIINRKKCVGAMVLFMIGLEGNFKKNRPILPTGSFLDEIIQLDNRQFKRYEKAKKSYIWRLK